MPTYDYECDNCGHKFEKFQSIKAPAIRKCPVCKKLRVRRLIGPGAGIIFKGSGFYSTDYRSEAYRKDASADKPSPKAKSSSESKASSDKPSTTTKADKPAPKKADK